MKAVVFVPGIMGTELFSKAGEMLWPPKPLETQFGYGRADKLLDKDVRPGGIIENVVKCFDVYGSLFAQFQQLGFEQDGAQNRLFPFPYDWRLDLEDTARDLARLLDDVDGAGAQDIFLIAHSMGGLVARLVLETGTYTNRPWFAKIRTFIAMATPHQGAPLALARVLGLDSTLGISKEDFRKLTSDPRYPSGYQLLPAPNEAACWSKADLAVGSVDIYDPAKAAGLGLDPALLARARFVHDSLARGAAPAGVRYFYFAGTGHETVTRVNVLEKNDTFPVEEMVLTRTQDAGDGTVPFWSALPRAVQKQVVVNEHMHVFCGMPFKRVFYRLLGGDLGVPLESINAPPPPGPTQLSIPTPVIQVNQAFELLVVPQPSAGKIDGKLLLQKLDDNGALVGAAEAMSTISYQGPSVSHLRLSMPAITTPGFFQLTFEGTPANSEPLRFAVVSFRKGK
jgi:phospholipase A1